VARIRGREHRSVEDLKPSLGNYKGESTVHIRTSVASPGGMLSTQDDGTGERQRERTDRWQTRRRAYRTWEINHKTETRRAGCAIRGAEVLVTAPCLYTTRLRRDLCPKGHQTLRAQPSQFPGIAGANTGTIFLKGGPRDRNVPIPPIGTAGRPGPLEIQRTLTAACAITACWRHARDSRD